MTAYRRYCLRRLRDQAWQASLDAEASGDRAEFLRHRQAWADACEELAKGVVFLSEVPADA
jgi:hypothetical protein